MTDDPESDAEFDQRVRLLAARRARQIVSREGMALVSSARGQDDDAVIADGQLLAIAIGQAILDAYAGDFGDEEEHDVPRTS